MAVGYRHPTRLRHRKTPKESRGGDSGNPSGIELRLIRFKRLTVNRARPIDRHLASTSVASPASAWDQPAPEPSASSPDSPVRNGWSSPVAHAPASFESQSHPHPPREGGLRSNV